MSRITFKSADIGAFEEFSIELSRECSLADILHSFESYTGYMRGKYVMYMARTDESFSSAQHRNRIIHGNENTCICLTMLGVKKLSENFNNPVFYVNPYYCDWYHATNINILRSRNDIGELQAKLDTLEIIPLAEELICPITHLLVSSRPVKINDRYYEFGEILRYLIYKKTQYNRSRSNDDLVDPFRRPLPAELIEIFEKEHPHVQNEENAIYMFLEKNFYSTHEEYDRKLAELTSCVDTLISEKENIAAQLIQRFFRRHQDHASGGTTQATSESASPHEFK